MAAIKRKVIEIISNNIYLLKSSWKLNKKIFFWYLFRIIIETIKPFNLIIFPKMILDEIIYNKRLDLIIKYLIIMCVFECILNVFSIIIKHICDDAYSITVNSTAVQYLEDYMDVDYKYNESNEMLDLAKQFFFHVQPAEFINLLSETLISIFKISASLYIIIELKSLFVLIMILFIVFNSSINKRVEKNIMLWDLEKIQHIRYIEYITKIARQYEYAKEVRINTLGNWINNKYNNRINNYKDSFKKYFNKFLKLKFIKGNLEIIQDIILYAYFSYKVIIGSISIGSFNMSIDTIRLLLANINLLNINVCKLIKLSTHIESYRKYKQLVENGVAKQGFKSIQEINLNDFDIEFCNVSFAYPHSNQVILKDISFKITKKEKVFILGINGAGKSTLIKLLYRLYEPTSGEIKINNININEFIYKEYIEFISGVLQDFKLLSFSIKDNIVLNGFLDDSRIKYSLEQTNLVDKIETLERGIETMINKEFDENGIEFSGGEGQRLALARAIYKDTSIVILDEPTSALDPLAEEKMFSNLKAFTNDKLAIYISHRISSSKDANKIIVLDKGKIIEQGNYEELMKEEGLYKEMYSKQAYYYGS